MNIPGLSAGLAPQNGANSDGPRPAGADRRDTSFGDVFSGNGRGRREPEVRPGTSPSRPPARVKEAGAGQAAGAGPGAVLPRDADPDRAADNSGTEPDLAVALPATAPAPAPEADLQAAIKVPGAAAVPDDSGASEPVLLRPPAQAGRGSAAPPAPHAERTTIQAATRGDQPGEAPRPGNRLSPGPDLPAAASGPGEVDRSPPPAAAPPGAAAAPDRSNGGLERRSPAALADLPASEERSVTRTGLSIAAPMAIRQRPNPVELPEPARPETAAGPKPQLAAGPAAAPETRRAAGLPAWSAVLAGSGDPPMPGAPESPDSPAMPEEPPGETRREIRTGPLRDPGQAPAPPRRDMAGLGGNPPAPEPPRRVVSAAPVLPISQGPISQEPVSLGPVSLGLAMQAAEPAAMAPVAAAASLPVPPEVARIAAPQLAAAIPPGSGAGQVELQLDPPELGRVEIRFDVTDQKLQATIIAERPAIGEMLRRHADILLTQLQQAGFVDIDLRFGRDNPASRWGAPPHPGPAGNRPADQPESGYDTSPATYRQRHPLNGLDLRF